jgi:hypothetical protein
MSAKQYDIAAICVLIGGGMLVGAFLYGALSGFLFK